MNEASWLMAAVFGLGWVLHVGAAVAFLLVVVLVVRRHRPDAWRTLLAAAVSQFVHVAVGLAFHLLTPVVSVAGGVDAMVMFQIVRGVVGSVISAVSVVLLLVGIVRVARPFVEPVPEGAPPYR